MTVYTDGGPAATPSRNPSANAAMSASERRDLTRLVRQREILLKKDAAERSARLTADFERQLAEKYYFSPGMEGKMEKIAEEEAENARARVKERCKQEGVPAHFIDRVNVHAHVTSDSCHFQSDYSAAGKLRKTAEAEIKAEEKTALVAIQRESLALQTEIVATGLGSATAHAFLERFSAIEVLMPPLDLLRIESTAKTVN